MKVQIEGNLYLESDDKQFIIKQYNGSVDKQGKETFTPKGYFSSVEGAMQYLLKMKIKESAATTLSELLRDVRELRVWIAQKIDL